MIESSFCVLSGVGLKTEQRLWQQGVGTWTEFLSSGIKPRPVEQREMRDTLAIGCRPRIASPAGRAMPPRSVALLILQPG